MKRIRNRYKATAPGGSAIDLSVRLRSTVDNRERDFAGYGLDVEHVVLSLVLTLPGQEGQPDGWLTNTFHCEVFINAANEVIITSGCQRHPIAWWRTRGLRQVRARMYRSSKLEFANRKAIMEALTDKWLLMLDQAERTIRAMDRAIAQNFGDGAPR